MTIPLFSARRLTIANRRLSPRLGPSIRDGHIRRREEQPEQAKMMAGVGEPASRHFEPLRPRFQEGLPIRGVATKWCEVSANCAMTTMQQARSTGMPRREWSRSSCREPGSDNSPRHDGTR